MSQSLNMWCQGYSWPETNLQKYHLDFCKDQLIQTCFKILEEACAKNDENKNASVRIPDANDFKIDRTYLNVYWYNLIDHVIYPGLA